MHRFMTHGTDPGTSGTTDGDLLRLVSEVKSLVQGAQPDAIARLGADRLTAFRDALQREQDAIRNAATQVKTAINSSLSVDDLARLGMAKLQELGAKSGVRINAGSPYDGYDMNAVMDEALREGREA